MIDEPSTRAPVQTRIAGDERPVGEVLSDLWHDTNRLVHQEVELVLAKLDTRVGELSNDLKRGAIAAAVLQTGLVALAASITLLLSQVMRPWLAALLVAVAFALVGILVLKAKGAAKKLDETDPPMTHNASLRRST